MDTRAIIKNMPGPVKQGIRYAYGAIPPFIRYGKMFWETYNFLQEAQWWSRGKLDEYQMQQLSKLLKHAYENVTYYRRVFDERGFHPKDIQNFDDLKKIPYLTKEIIQDCFPDLIASNYPKSKLLYATTGGSTGIPLGFYDEKVVSGAKERAFMVTQWRRVGYKIGDRCVVLRGFVVDTASRGKLWKYDPIEKNLYLSSYHMTEETLPTYIEKIREFKPDFIQAYPSSITILAKYIKDTQAAPFSGIKALLCGSENLYQWQREFLTDVFQCRVYSWYGHSEKAALAGECERNTCYHIFPEYGFVELAAPSDKTNLCESELREIVATGFNNYVFPFIRYRTMDLAIPSHTKCDCGRNYPLLEKVEGRLQDLVVAKGKRFITLTALIFAQHFEAFSRVKAMQLYQEKEGVLTVRIVKTTSYSEKDEREILLKMKGACGTGLDINFVYLEHIPRTKSGKHRFLIQNLTFDSRILEGNN